MCSKDVDGHAYGKVTGLSRFSIFVSFICASCYCAAFVGSGWVHTKEPYRLTNLNLYTSVTFNIGLWKACHSFKRINSTINLPQSCTSISYSNWSEFTAHNLSSTSDIESTINVITRVRWPGIFISFGFILSLTGFVYSIIGHYHENNKTLLASAIYTLSGLSLAAGLFIFVCVLTDAFAGHAISYDRHYWDTYESKRSHGYKYGWCFFFACLACICAEITGVLCITVHYRRCQTLAQIIRDIMPVREEKSPNSYFSTKDTGCLVKPDEFQRTESKMQPDDTNGILLETPPDICSTFLNADQTEESTENNVQHTKNLEEKYTQCAYRSRKNNFATLNTRNYRCLNYSSVPNKRHSTLSGCNLSMDDPSSSTASSSNTFSPTQYHQNMCIQNTIPRMKSCTGNSNKYHIIEKNTIHKISEMQQISCDDFKL